MMRNTLSLLALNLAALSPLAADSILLDSNEVLTGELIDMQASFVILSLPENEGEALRRISPERIKALHFEDSDAPLEQRALKRAKFQPLLSESDARLQTELLSKYIQLKNPLPALSYARSWHSKNNYPALDSVYRNLLLKSALAANLPGEALVHAQNWLALSPPPFPEPLPWQVIAQSQLDSGNPEAALWTALTPIAHANSANSDSLAPLHEIAATAYQELGFTDHAAAHRSRLPHKIANPDSRLALNQSPYLNQLLHASLPK